MDILVQNREALEKITQALLEFETIDGSEVDMLVNGAAVSEIHKVRANKKDGGGFGSDSSEKNEITEVEGGLTGKKPVPVS